MKHPIGTKHSAQSVLKLEDFSNGSTPPTQDIYNDFVNWEFTINDDSLMYFYVPDNWYIGTDIRFKLLWFCQEAYAVNSGEIQWEFDVESVKTDGSEAITAGYTNTVQSGDINLPATADTFVLTTLMTIDGSNIDIDDIIRCKLSRITLNGGANPAGEEPGAVALKVEYISNFPTYREIT